MQYNRFITVLKQYEIGYIVERYILVVKQYILSIVTFHLKITLLPSKLYFLELVPVESP